MCRALELPVQVRCPKLLGRLGLNTRVRIGGVYGLYSCSQQGNLAQLHGFESNLVTSVYSTNEIFVQLYDHDNCITNKTFYDFVQKTMHSNLSGE